MVVRLSLFHRSGTAKLSSKSAPQSSLKVTGPMDGSQTTFPSLASMVYLSSTNLVLLQPSCFTSQSDTFTMDDSATANLAMASLCLDEIRLALA